MSKNNYPWDVDDDEWEIVYTGYDFDIIPKNKVDKEKKRCDHEWMSQRFFTSKIYETCKKCGAKKEEL